MTLDYCHHGRRSAENTAVCHPRAAFPDPAGLQPPNLYCTPKYAAVLPPDPGTAPGATSNPLPYPYPHGVGLAVMPFWSRNNGIGFVHVIKYHLTNPDPNLDPPTSLRIFHTPFGMPTKS